MDNKPVLQSTLQVGIPGPSPTLWSRHMAWSFRRVISAATVPPEMLEWHHFVDSHGHRLVDLTMLPPKLQLRILSNISYQHSLRSTQFDRRFHQLTDPQQRPTEGNSTLVKAAQLSAPRLLVVLYGGQHLCTTYVPLTSRDYHLMYLECANR